MWEVNCLIVRTNADGEAQLFCSKGNPMEIISGANLGKTLRRLPYWQELVKQKAEQGEWLRPYSFRDTYSLVC